MLKEILAEKDYLDILKMSDGTEVTKENWQRRREEMVMLLEKYSYGKAPKIPVRVCGENQPANRINERTYAGKVR